MLSTSTTIVCPTCGVPFTRTGAARSSDFYRTREENDTCIVCREGLDPVTLEPLAARGATMKKPADHGDAELLEAIELAAARARLAGAGDLRKSADVLAGLALEAAGRLRVVLELTPTIDVGGAARRVLGAIERGDRDYGGGRS